MARNSLLSFIFLLFVVAAFAQSDLSKPRDSMEVYPVRVGHKWGYVKIYPGLVDTVVPPRYDFIGDVNLPWNHFSSATATSPYRLFELDGKVGLLDGALQEIIPNRYKRIRALTAKYFAVELDSLFLLVHVDGAILLDSSRYDDICAADQSPDGEVTSFFVKKGSFWGVHRKGGALIIPSQYAAIEPVSKSGFYKVRTRASDVNWRLIDERGQLILKDRYRDIQVLNENWIAVKGATWKMMHRSTNKKTGTSGFEMSNKAYREVEKINEHLVVLVPSDTPRVQLWSIPQQALLANHAITGEEKQPDKTKGEDPYFPWYESLDDRYSVFKPVSYAYKLIDTSGKAVSTLLNTVEPAGLPGYYFINYRNKWGILAPEQDTLPIVKLNYDEFFPFQNGVTICKKGSRYGAFSIKNGQVDSLLCIYTSITPVAKNKFWMPVEDNVVQYRVSAQGKFELDSIFPNTLSVAGNVQKQTVEAEPLLLKQIPGYKIHNLPEDAIRIMQQDSIEGTIIRKLHELKNSNNLVEFVPKWTTEIPVKRKIIKALEVWNDSLLAFYHADALRENVFTQMLSDGAFSSAHFFDMARMQYLSHVEMIGFRTFDSTQTHTTFIDARGQMGLINRQGQELLFQNKPVRFTYIGPFVAGRARVCMGGKLVLDANDKLAKPEKFVLSDQKSFIKEFNILETKPIAFSKRDKGIYVVETDENPCRWAYIDTNGEVILTPNAEHIEDFHPRDRTAFVLKQNKRIVLEKPDADYGVIDYNGKEIIPIEYSNIVRDTDYFMLGIDSTPTFYFNKKGYQIFENPTRLRPFYEGLAQFKDSNDRWGYLDTNGVVVIPAQFKTARPFFDGLALVVDAAGFCLFINTNGKIAFQTQFTEKEGRGIGDFHNGRCWYKKRGAAWLWGCLNKKGESVIPPKFMYDPAGNFPANADDAYTLPLDFSQGVAAVTAVDASGQLKAAVIDTLGNFVLKPDKLAIIHRFDENGLAVFLERKEGAKGLLNREGKILATAQYHHIDNFINGFAKVRKSSGTWGIINKQGVEVVPPIYNQIDTVSEGLVAVKPASSSNWIVIDPLNNVRIPGPFTEIEPFKDGVTFVTEAGKNKIINTKGEAIRLATGEPLFFGQGLFGMNELLQNGQKSKHFFYADASGNNIFSRYFEAISAHRLGVAKVSRTLNNRKLLGAINIRGVAIVPLKYGNLHIQPDGNIIINPQRFFGLADKTGKILVEPAYDRIYRFHEKGIFRLERGEKVGYIWAKNNKVEWVWNLGN